MADFDRESMMDMFVFESTQLLEQLEQNILDSEQTRSFNEDSINEIFRIMHTIKGSAAMMLFEKISALAHSVEDLFYFIREGKKTDIDYSRLSDLVLESVDFIKLEMEKIKNGDRVEGDTDSLVTKMKTFLDILKEDNVEKDKKRGEGKNENVLNKNQEMFMNNYKAVIFFEDGCEMENIRAFGVIHNLEESAANIKYIPNDIMDNDESVEVIRKDGFQVSFSSKLVYEEINKMLMDTVFLKDLKLTKQDENTGQTKETVAEKSEVETEKSQTKKEVQSNEHQSIISVNVAKLDKLMDLVGELVISEAMVTQNPDLKGLTLDNFKKAARQLKKISTEIQDTVMSIRMVPLAVTFHKMNRIVRDMNKKLDKDVKLEIIGEDTEVDKNIIEHISDPLMHLIRNSIDHGIETAEERKNSGKTEGKILLEAKNAGSEVLIIVKDNGKGLNKEKILKKARENGLIHKPESEMTNKEIFSLILRPGFSTKEKVTEFSGRGVGMDVVVKNIEVIGGTIAIDSVLGEGTTISLKIPLTLAIIDGMNVRVGNGRYTIPTMSIRQSFKVREESVIVDPDGNESIMLRGKCYPVLRLHEMYKAKTDITKITDGIIIMVEHELSTVCIFADELLGEQQVVVKALPKYIKKIKGIGGCTLLGDGNISLILDIANLINCL